MAEDEIRNENHGIEGGAGCSCGQCGGVGARRQQLPLPLGGGGYLDICTNPKPPIGGSRGEIVDPRIKELKDSGMAPVWVQIAERVGFDAFMDIWEQLLESNVLDAVNRIYVPRLSRYQRIQRNSYILELSRQGKDADQIRRQVLRELGASITRPHIQRLMAQLAQPNA